MLLHETDLFVAAGNKVRVASLAANRNKNQAFKTLHTPNISFEIHEIVLNPTAKLLAVAGEFQVAVIVLPRSGVNHLVPDVVDCKYVLFGCYCVQFYLLV